MRRAQSRVSTGTFGGRFGRVSVISTGRGPMLAMLGGRGGSGGFGG